MTQIVWLARHGNRQDFVDETWPETAERPFDPGLSPDGIGQAKKLGNRLKGEGIGYLFASPYLRTVETAHYVAEALDLPIYIEPGLGEWLNPEWFPAMPERLPLETLTELFPRIEPKYTPYLTPEYPETLEEAFARAREVAHRLAEAYTRPILLIGHGASVSGAACGLAGLGDDLECALCSVFKLVRREDGWEMELRGDVTHLGHSEAALRFNY